MTTFRENYLCARLALPIQSSVPNLKSLAQAVLEILTLQWLTWLWTTSKQRWRSFILVPIDFLYAVNSNFCSRTHWLATIHSVQTTDRRNPVA